MVSFKYIEGKQSYVKHNKICFRTFSKSLAQGKAMDYNKNQKQRRKSRGITLIVFVVTIIVLIILAGVTINLIAGEKEILNRAIQSSLQNELSNLEEKANLIYADLLINKHFDKNNQQTINLVEIIKELQKENYTFLSVANTEDAKTCYWVNATNSDGSYFVWIPRYAYRITYYENQETTQPTGYYDGNGIWRASDARVKYTLDAGIETVEHNGKSYIVHPAFMKDDDKEGLENFARGGWDSDLAGLWVAKYEMSQERNGTAYATNSVTVGNITTTDSIKAVSKPNVSCWRYINIGNMYTNAFNYDRSKESHLMKNSEWGVVAYLTHSQYGRNAHEIATNTSSSYITGTGGVEASTTGNLYGIYDMSGGAWEYLACWDTLSTSSFLKNGLSFAKTNGVSTKYATAYKNVTSENLYKRLKIGDAIKEVKVDGTYAWFGDTCFAFYLENPFLLRGGSSNDGTSLGIYYSDSFTGAEIDKNNSFRVVIAPR